MIGGCAKPVDGYPESANVAVSTRASPVDSQRCFDALMRLLDERKVD